MNAIEILEHIQKENYIKANKSISERNDVNSDDYWNYITDLLADNPDKDNIILGMRNAKKNKSPVVLLTKYENYSHYCTLIRLFEKIEKVKDNVLGFHKIIPPANSSLYFGTIEGSFNAFSMYCSGKDRLIILSSWLFNYAYRLSSILSLFFPFKKKVDELHGDFSYALDDVKNSIKNSPEIITLFCDLMLVCMYGEDPIKSINVKSNDPHVSMLAAQFYDSFLSFVISHEYSHFLLNHFDDIKNDSLHDSIDITLKLHTLEYRADILALRLTIAALQYNNNDYVKNMIGIISCMKLVEYLEKLHCIRDNGESIYPFSKYRLDNILQEWNDDIFNYEKSLFIEINIIFDFMWDKFMFYHNVVENHYKKRNKDIFSQKFVDIQKFMFELSQRK